jgi:hypothetical protein
MSNRPLTAVSGLPPALALEETMTTNNPKKCFNCEQTEDEIPVLSWSFQGRPFVACSQCVPTLIHKWQQIVAVLSAQSAGAPDE